MRSIKEAMRDHAPTREARQTLERVIEQRDAVGLEVDGLKEKLEALGARIDAVTEAGDPEGIIRDLSKERRKLRDALEDAEADLAAQEAARNGARDRWQESRLRAMEEAWQTLPVEEAVEAFQAAVFALEEALAPIEEIEGEAKWAHDLSNHIIGHFVPAAQAARLDSPDLGVPGGEFRAFATTVQTIARRIRENTQPQQQETAA